MFVHCYLQLVTPDKELNKEKAKSAARTLMDRYGEVRRVWEH